MEKSAKCICIFNSSNTWGGGEKWFADALPWLHERGWKLLLMAHPQGMLREKTKHLPITFFPVNAQGLSFLNPVRVLQLQQVFQQQKVTHLLVTLPKDLKYAGLAARLALVSEIIYRRGSAIAVKNTCLNRMLFRSIVSRVIVNSKKTGELLLTNNPNLISKAHIHLIYNGIDIKEYPLHTPKDRDVPVIGTLGRLVEQKGQILFLEALSLLKKQGVAFRAKIGGEGPLAGKIRQEVVRLDLKKEVNLSGFVDDVSSFMQGLDIFCLPSHWEGFGFVLAEAMSTGLAVVAFDVSSNAEIVPDSSCLVPYADTQLLAAKLAELLQDKEKRITLGLQGRKKVETHFLRDMTYEKLNILLMATP